MKELPKNYEAKNYENELYEAWEKSGFFNPDVCLEKGVSSEESEKFSIVLPPPNVTGVLHMGHAAMLAIQDVLIRYNRMKGNGALWLPGTDHAAIATQTKVEKLLIEKGIKDPRVELGREKFLDEVKKFASESHDTIVNQSKKMGASLDWSREAYTLDEVRNETVKKVFKMMYDDGLIEKGYRIVNWCPRCHSTLADDEVEYKEQKAKFYTFKYSKEVPFSISTTRPETKLGDTAVAVNPEDNRYKKYIGQEFIVSNFAGGADLKIKVIADESVDMNFGTGALGVTPAHSHVDYEMALKNSLPVIKVIDEDGKMTQEAGEDYVGMTVLEAREKVVKSLQENGLLEKEEEIDNNLSICYRCGSAIEPLPSEQWFVRVNKKFKIKGEGLRGFKKGDEATLKEVMLGVVKNGQIEIIPDRFNKTYFHWIENLRDWCISRQIWFGHQIPVWYKGDEVFVGSEAPEGEGWTQDPDTLDTWFSSGLWTFSTLAHKPEDVVLENGELKINTSDFKKFHPISVMETGYDILFFWVARMILMTGYALGEVPFEKVYLHGLVRDEEGRKMSKSLGNVIDPLLMIDKYGTDATRLSLLLGTSPGNDMKLSEEKVAGFKNFTNKLWNISRFMLLNISEPRKDMVCPEAKTQADKWFLNQLDNMILSVTSDLKVFNFPYAGEKLRGFTWDVLADWYLEISKIEGEKSEILNYVLNTILKLWHPFMPFVTEAIWREVYGNGEMIMVEKWPEVLSEDANEDAEVQDFENIVKNIITEIRVRRAEQGIEPSKKIKGLIVAGDKKDLVEQNQELIKRLWTNVEDLEILSEISDKPEDKVMFSVSGVDVYLDFSGAIDKEKEIKRLNKEKEEKEKYINSLSKKLDNEEFVKNAPEQVVQKEQEKLAEAKSVLEKVNEQLIKLS